MKFILRLASLLAVVGALFVQVGHSSPLTSSFESVQSSQSSKSSASSLSESSALDDQQTRSTTTTTTTTTTKLLPPIVTTRYVNYVPQPQRVVALEPTFLPLNPCCALPATVVTERLALVQEPLPPPTTSVVVSPARSSSKREQSERHELHSSSSSSFSSSSQESVVPSPPAPAPAPLLIQTFQPVQYETTRIVSAPIVRSKTVIEAKPVQQIELAPVKGAPVQSQQQQSDGWSSSSS